jgi:transposase
MSFLPHGNYPNDNQSEQLYSPHITSTSHALSTKQHNFSQPPPDHNDLKLENVPTPEGSPDQFFHLALIYRPTTQTGSDFTGNDYIPERRLLSNLLPDDTTSTIEIVKKRKRRKRSIHTEGVGDGADSLNMRGWRGFKPVHKRHETIIPAELLTELTHCACKKCKGDCCSTNLKANGPTKIQHLHHTPSDERPRRIEYRKQRYLCLDCKHTSLQPIPGVYNGTNMTRQLRRYIARQGLVESFSIIAKRVGRSERDIRKIFEKHRAHLESIRKVETPRVMGWDGVYVKRKESLIVTDLERKRPVLMCPFIKERPVVAALRKMQGIDEAEDVVTDMSGSLRRVKKAAVPKARHTDDRYHVQRMANVALDLVRRALTPGKRERKKGQMGMCSSHILRKRKNKLKAHEKAALDWCLGLYPLLRLTYELKEAYCEVWSALDSATARRRYADWLERHKLWKKEMPKDLQAAFDLLIRAMKNWDEEIFNYFEGRYTNAYTESANAKVKEITRKAPRAKFSTVSTKVIHGRRLEQQREAARQKGKKDGRQAGTTQQPQPSPPAATVQEVTPSREEQTPFAIQSPSAVDLKRQGPRLDVARIVSLRRRKEEIPAVPLSPQMPLFQ